MLVAVRNAPRRESSERVARVAGDHPDLGTFEAHLPSCICANRRQPGRVGTLLQASLETGTDLAIRA